MTITPTYTAAELAVPTVTATDLITSGNVQLVVSCPRCGCQHRHLGLGLRRSPCGAWYVLTTPAPTSSAPKLAAA